VIDANGHEIRTKQAVIAADMTGVDMILGLPWLRELNPDIDWPSGMVRWRTDNAGDTRKRVHAVVAESGPEFENSGSTSPNRDDAENAAKDRHNADIAVVSQLTFEKYCKRKDVQAFILQCNDMLDIESSMSDLTIGTVVEPPKEIPEKYKDFADVFDKVNADKLPEHDPQDHAIDTEGKMPPFGPVYNLSVTELELLREYLDEFLAKGFIVPSSSPAGAPILFVKKPGGGLRLCVDYRGLNAITVKNRYPIPLVNQLLNRLSGVKKFTKLDIQAAYNFIRIKEGDE
jgi:hypothetical protein